MNLPKDEILMEEKHLNRTLKVIKSKLSELGQDLYEKQERVMEFKQFIWNSKSEIDPTEMKTLINASDLEVALADNKSKYMQKLYRIQDNPYFGSIEFEDAESNKKVYIGITYVEDEENDEYLVNDWRAPISSLFYDYEVGKAEYIAPEGIIKGEIKNKRQFNIKDGKLVRVFDNNINIDDELLQEVLAQESNEKMKNIVNTIQAEQNQIIRNVEDKNLIVQGIAGSGKTSVALHRIAFLLYKIENLSSNNILIFSPNKVFTEYISNVLPELGENNTLQTTFSEFLQTTLPEYKKVESFSNFIERYYKKNVINEELIKYKQSDKIIEDMDNYIKDFIDSLEFKENICTHDYELEKDELDYLLKDRFNKMLITERFELIADKVCNDYFHGKHGKKKQIISYLLKNLNKEINYKKIYKDFFNSKYFLDSYNGEVTESEIDKAINSKEINYEDACLMVYLKGMISGFDYRGLIKEIVIDEAQDYNMLQLKLIRKIFAKSNFTILGDTNQTINPYYKYESLNDLFNIFKEDTKYLELNKTYRSSPEIIEYTNSILNLQHVSAIRKDNNKPVIVKNETNIKYDLIEDINNLENNNNKIAIITKTDDEANRLYELLKDEIKGLELLNGTSTKFEKNRIIVPSYIAKGLEFDSVIVYTSKDNKYTEKEKYLFYVACTRAQHELIVYNQ